MRFLSVGAEVIGELRIRHHGAYFAHRVVYSWFLSLKVIVFKLFRKGRGLIGKIRDKPNIVYPLVRRRCSDPAHTFYLPDLYAKPLISYLLKPRASHS